MRRLALLLIVVTMTGCANQHEEPVVRAAVALDIQGHRGARGLAPENTIPSFLIALDHGATTLELDVAISADNQVVLSHEPWMSHTICSHPDGKAVTQQEARSLNLHDMTASEIAEFDCGLRGHPGFPEQVPMAVHKPTLADLVAAIEQRGESPRYNIEIKSWPEGDGVFHPNPDAFASLLLAQLRKLGLMEHSNVQSFDPRALEAVRQQAPDLPLAWLVGNDDGFKANMNRLSFVPEIYSPGHALVDTILVRQVHEIGMLLVPWTVNDTSRMAELVSLGVDGLITDYPDRAASLDP